MRERGRRPHDGVETRFIRSARRRRSQPSADKPAGADLCVRPTRSFTTDRGQTSCASLNGDPSQTTPSSTTLRPVTMRSAESGLRSTVSYRPVRISSEIPLPTANVQDIDPSPGPWRRVSCDPTVPDRRVGVQGVDPGVRTVRHRESIDHSGFRLSVVERYDRARCISIDDRNERSMPGVGPPDDGPWCSAGIVGGSADGTVLVHQERQR
jgi:hypothetical protein